MLKIIFIMFTLYFGNELNANNLSYNDALQSVYIKTPVKSYKAYPDDNNFIPETEFMQRDDSLNYDNNIEQARAIETLINPGVNFAEKPMIICRDHACTKLNNRITRTFLFNTLTSIFMTNTSSRIFTCEADPFSRSCLQTGISFPARVGAANALIKIPKATINQVDVSSGISKVSIGIIYEFLLNGINRNCESTVMDLIVPISSQAVLLNREFACDMTSDGMTNISFMINVDYIDLDYGIIGGYYSLGLQGSSSGGGTGYVLLKTEFTTKGIKYKSNSITNKVESDLQSIKPGEYFVEPFEK